MGDRTYNLIELIQKVKSEELKAGLYISNWGTLIRISATGTFLIKSESKLIVGREEFRKYSEGDKKWSTT